MDPKEIALLQGTRCFSCDGCDGADVTSEKRATKVLCFYANGVAKAKAIGEWCRFVDTKPNAPLAQPENVEVAA